MVELRINGELADMSPDVDIKYTRQIADVFDLAAVSSSYTNSFTLEKTPNNTAIMQQLGIIGDTSTVPYSKIYASLSENGFSIIKSGLLQVKETSDNYKVSILDGMVDFLKAIENKTMGTDLDLTRFNHEKNIETVIDSFTNPNYKYIIADYNGRVEFGGGINIDYLVPCFNMGVLMQIVMQSFGYTFSNLGIEELDDLYITYPKSPDETTVPELYAQFNKGLYVVTTDFISPGIVWPASQRYWDSSTINFGSLIDNWIYVFSESEAYKISFTNESYSSYIQQPFMGISVEVPNILQVLLNGTVVLQYASDPYEEVSASVNIFCRAGDILEFRILAQYSLNDYVIHEIHHKSTVLKVEKTNQGNIALSDAFKDFQIKDFFKECMWITGVTPIIDVPNKYISFISLNDRLDFANSVDWSDKYIERNGETYNSGLAQKNVFKHKYDDPNNKSSDGYLYSDNRNLADEKTLVQSKLYAPEDLLTAFFSEDLLSSFSTSKFKIWNRETKEDNDGNLSIEYKGLKDRFYLMKIKQSPVSSWLLTSEAILGSSETVSQLPYADTEGSTYSQIVPKNYSSYSGVINNFRSHNIDLAMSIVDFLNTEMQRPVYFQKEASYFILNKLNYQSGRYSTGEFVKINKIPTVPLSNSVINVSILAYGIDKIRFRLPVLNGFGSFVDADSMVVINGVELPFESSTSDDNQIILYLDIPEGNQEVSPTVTSFIIYLSDGINTRKIEYNGTQLIFSPTDQSEGNTKTVKANVTDG